MNIGFTGKAQNALNRALYCACEMGHTCVGSEHLLLGLLSESEGIASKVLDERGVTFDNEAQRRGYDSAHEKDHRIVCKGCNDYGSRLRRNGTSAPCNDG